MSVLPLTLAGIVVHGDKRGKQLVFPTANISLPNTLNLKKGVYYGQLIFDGESKNFVMSYGDNIHFDKQNTTLGNKIK